MIPKNSRQELFQRIFALGIFWGKVIRYVSIPLIFALSPGRSDITRFRPWSPIVPDRKLFGSRRKIPKLLRRLIPLTFSHFGTHFAESFRMSKSSIPSYFGLRTYHQPLARARVCVCVCVCVCVSEEIPDEKVPNPPECYVMRKLLFFFLIAVSFIFSISPFSSP